MAAKLPISLAWRLVLVAGAWASMALFVAGWILVGLFENAGVQALDERLDVHMTSIVRSIAQNPQGSLKEPSNLGEARFQLPLSGWYWSIRDKTASGTILFDSPSLFGDTLSLPPARRGEAKARFIKGPSGQELRLLERKINFPERGDLVIAVAGSTRELGESTASFAKQAALTLGVLGLGLIGAIVLQVRFGLLPVTRLKASLSAVRRGSSQNIDEDMPKELKPLAVELNALIRSNEQIVEHARTQVGNLAHGLKTPLAVIANEARTSKGPFADHVEKQAELMRTQITTYLERARMAAQRRVIGVSTPVEPVVSRLTNAMEKIYRHKDLEFSVHIESALLFRGESADLEEILGNLLDNACKWCAHRVTVSAQKSTSQNGEREMFEISVADDGPGLSEEQRKKALKRGQRLDETTPGTGLGLSIVSDLTSIYGGSVELERSELGGLYVRIFLPALAENSSS
ncbi:ATP-binding protein [Flexibacterium corallicola]|uniref:ATP-binding protein n=1 Tax=Flexibacterium corallicola TaxID=3037259 RepID=UPI00286EDCE7|nr:ATP-binding protein [Pseudovibrio sp. M1P-2-3]